MQIGDYQEVVAYHKNREVLVIVKCTNVAPDSYKPVKYWQVRNPEALPKPKPIGDVNRIEFARELKRQFDA